MGSERNVYLKMKTLPEAQEIVNAHFPGQDCLASETESVH